MRRATEATFARQVLRAPVPAIVCFGARGCPGFRALLPALERVEAVYGPRLIVAAILLDAASFLAEQYGVAASPTLMVFEHGDRQSQVVGFIPEGLIGLLAEEVAQGCVTGDSFWNPAEERFEDTVLIPLLRGWGLTVRRQVACALPQRNRAQRGRIDLLVYDHPERPPLTLVESKRQIRGDDELRQAAEQAAAYARSLALPSFIVAAPRGMWVYRCDERRSACVRHLSSLELHQAPERCLQLLQQLRANP